ncbi:MAG: rhomboid family intramembrane serine protease [Chloroflexi bacterium]|nr:rhomboid family intramembrane serine protease [Chloroflexota bacterium]
MIPISDSLHTHRFPWVNLLLILASALVFLYELSLGPRLDAFVLHWGATPTLVLRALGGNSPAPSAVLLTLLTSQFIHAGWGHLLGNMLFLFVFGRAVEDRLGHLPYLIIYLAWGAGAALVQILLTGPTQEPLVGASGAISGVLGAYFILFPHAWVSLLVPIFFFFWVIDVPALLVLAYWFLVQFVNGAAAITRASQATVGVAFWAHVGGFLLGMVCVVLLPRRPQPAAATRPSEFRKASRSILWRIACLPSTVAGALAALVAARMLLLLSGIAGRGLLGILAWLVYDITTPLVKPFAGTLPTLLVGGRELELFSLAAFLTYWSIGALLAWIVEAASNRR